jgi:YidC/Oxa1 family membrane protein insertase
MFASVLGQFGHPFYVAFAWILSGTYALIPNYALAIALLTLVVMVALYPITQRGMRSALKMRVLAPEIEELRAEHTLQPGLPHSHRKDLQQRQQAELMELYKENDISPAGGCLPIVLQFPILIVLYGTIRGLVHQTVVQGVHVADPLYVGHGTKLFNAIAAAHGHLVAFGLNLADSARTPGLEWATRSPFIALVLVAVALAYVQMRRTGIPHARPAAAISPVQRVQSFVPLLVPLVLTVVYLSVPSGVIVYFIASSLIRILQQAVMHRRDPQIRTSLEKLHTQFGSG